MATEPEPEPQTRRDHDDEVPLKPFEKTALLELRFKLEDAIRSNRLLQPPTAAPCPAVARARVASFSSSSSSSPVTRGVVGDEEEDSSCSVSKDVSLWGVPLLPSRRHEGTNTVLLKFLRAREFKAGDALEMLRRTLRWRREFGADTILDDDGEEDEMGWGGSASSATLEGTDKEGRPVCYHVLEEDEEVEEAGSAAASRRRQQERRFLRWRVQSMERSVGHLSFKPGGVASTLQITDLNPNRPKKPNRSNRPSKDKNDVCAAMITKAATLLDDNYPELVAKNIFVNVSFRHYAYHALVSHFTNQRYKSKFIFARPSKVTQTLLKFIPAEKLPVQYGGLGRNDDEEFTAEDSAAELIVRGGKKGTIEIPVTEAGVTAVWDVSVVGWEVKYKEEFIPDDEGSYKVLIQKEKKLKECVRNSFYISEPGKVVITVENRTFNKKRVLHRSKSKPTIPLYSLLKQISRPLA